MNTTTTTTSSSKLKKKVSGVRKRLISEEEKEEEEEEEEEDNDDDDDIFVKGGSPRKTRRVHPWNHNTPSQPLPLRQPAQDPSVPSTTVSCLSLSPLLRYLNR